MNHKSVIGWCSFCILIASGIFSGCIDSSLQTMQVLVSIVPQQEMVESIGGSFVSVTVLVPAGQSPHSYEPTPSQLIDITQAEAYFIVGSGVEFEIAHMNTIRQQNTDLKIFDCSKDIKVLSFDEHYRQVDYNEGNHDYEGVLEHGGTDPHVWTSPLNYRKMAEVVYMGLVEIDPDHQQDYYENYQQYLQKLEGLHANISALLSPFENRSFMVYHPSWGYFGDTYHLIQLSIEENGTKPGFLGVASIIEQAQSENISVIFVSPQFDTSSAEAMAEEINGEVVYANPLMQNYTQTLMNLAGEMAGGFQRG